MLQIYICVGSSCHLKGSYHIIKTFQNMIADNKLEEKVELKASFCLGRCTEGVSIKIGDDFIPNVTVSNAEQKFMEHVMERLK
ncbi:(2Fe-2S) ferredoxin domain-containing protein [Petroclostridium sp. X23]|uniref:(2Fe-2S) ferredoxin domain-containing protein n=1 Tax=Petroclostridium sp. X23 TaxID=3045146 RepID=UPI0024AD28A1|nr:(2Fe-2S) ferredoxin domain-containing protein [Petroclostridium sp. X23]WHH57340.1 (2Fe-2S) ferredoxin domain-containing protein [Petroclostridium sp. X23]